MYFGWLFHLLIGNILFFEPIRKRAATFVLIGGTVRLINSQDWLGLQAIKEYLTVTGPAKIIQPPMDMKAIAGESVLFTCASRGNPTPKLTFHWNDEEIKHSKPGLQVKVLSPTSIGLRAKLDAKHHNNRVTCETRNQLGSDSAVARITVYKASEAPPAGFPKVRQGPSATISQVSSSAQLQCDVAANPKPTVSWIKDQYHLIDLTSPRFRLVGSGSLIIESLEETDSGTYECMAQNDIGTVLSNSGHLHVRRIQFPPSINELPEIVEVAPGRGTNLTCRASGFPVPMVWWSTLGRPAGPRPNVLAERPLTEMQKNEATLRLTDITESQDYNCIAKNGLGLVRQNVSVIVKELPAPPADLDVRPIGATYAVLWWRPTPSPRIDSYTISLTTNEHGLGDLGRKQVTNVHPLGLNKQDENFVTYNLTELIPYTEYSIRVHAVSRNLGLSPPSNPVTFRTAELPPSTPPQSVHANVLSPSSVQVIWDPPVEANGRITGYKVYYTLRREDPISSWLVDRTSEQQYRLTQLVANATYFIKVNAYNAAGDGPMSEVFPVIVTPGVPSAPTNFQGEPTDPDTIKLVWQAPDVPNGYQLLDYQLRYRSTSEANRNKIDQEVRNLAIEPHVTVYYLKGLVPSTVYYISLAGRTTSGVGVWAQIEVTTTDRLPEMPHGRQIVTLGPKTVQVTWTDPNQQQQSDIKHYIVKWRCVDCLNPLTELPPLPLFDKTKVDQNPYYQSEPTRVGVRKVLANYASGPDHVYTATIGDLLPDTSYLFSVAAANLHGAGMKYSYPIVRTKTQTSLKPKNFHLVSWNKRPRPRPIRPEQDGAYPIGMAEMSYVSVELAWDPPDGLRTSQQITYQVYAQLVGPQELVNELTQKPALTDFGNGGPFGTHVRHSLLDRRLLANVTGNTFRSSETDNIGYGATYQFEVSLLNTSFGESVATLNVTIPDAPPSSSPLHVRLSGLSSSAVEISWAPPPVQYRNGRITAYQIRYFEVGAEARTEVMAKVTVPGQRQYVAKDLKEKTYYTFMVRAYTSAGHGPWTGASNIRTSVELPPPPLDIRATRINQHQVKVTWRTPSEHELTGGGAGQSRGRNQHLTIQGFRLLYSPINNPYEAGQWTSFDVGPVNMAIISHLESQTSYLICIKSRGVDGRYGDCSQPVTSPIVNTGESVEFSVRNLLCTGDETSVKVTWQQPVRTKQLAGFKLRVGGSKRFADGAGVLRTLDFPARSVSVAYAPIHSGYTYTVSDLEPNSIYDIQLSAYYELTLEMESNWETTSCYTQMQRPQFVAPPVAVAVSAERRQVLVQLTRVSERLGKIRHYFLVVAPIHLADSLPEKIDIEQTITSSRSRSSTETRYVAARFQQEFFDPPPRHAKNFTLGALISRFRRDVRTKRQIPPLIDHFTSAMVADINFDNKALVIGQEYKAFIRACVFQTEHSTSTGPNICSSSEWSTSFGPDHQLPPWNQLMEDIRSNQQFDPEGKPVDPDYQKSVFGSSGPFGWKLLGNDILVITVVAVVMGLVLFVIIFVAICCFLKKRRRTKLLTPTSDPGMKQPLMRMNDCGSLNGAALNMIPHDGTGMNTCPLMGEKRNSLVTGSMPPNHMLPASPPRMNHHNSLISSMTTGGRSLLGAGAAISSCTSSPMPGMEQLQTPSGVGQFGYVDSMGATFMNNRGGTLSSNAGSHPGSMIGQGPPSTLGLSYTVGSGSVLCDGLVIEQNGLSGSYRGGADNLFDDVKSYSLKHSIPINCLSDHIARLSAADNLLFAQEYESIETERQFTWENSNMEVNKPKNRYANVIAYDHSRVILQSIDGIPGSDYINANYIDGHKRPNAYIATQGPMPETYSDFWRMIWEQRVFIIVMMTRLEERSRVKCDQYWPSRGPESYAGGLLTVSPVETVELAYYTIRTFNLTARGIDDECREIRHFQFTHWPDHGVPESPIPLLLFIRRVRTTLASTTSALSVSGGTSLIEQGPVIVHCSAGVGRTGAFIVIDMMLERIKYDKSVDIYACVKALRGQRNFMVQTEEQYIFIHTALIEAIDAGNTEVPARNLLAHVKKLRALDANGGSGMELEFKKLQQFRVPRVKYTSAQLVCNKHKNRHPHVSPFESTRVILQPIRGVEGSDYMNGSFVDSYRARRAYIATQGPMAKTVEDFWRMIWELNTSIVVMLGKLYERGRECCYPYWPSERSARYQYYVVDPMVEYNMPNYTLREFKLTDARDGHSRTLRQFQFTEWPEQGSPESCEAFIEFLGQVHKTKEQFGQDGPITVHCSNGIGRTGVFLTLSILLERMRYEGVVDMFQTVRLLRTQRAGFIETEDQYQFVYNAALTYLSSFDHYST